MLNRRLPLLCAPTPLHRLSRLSEQLQIELWIKRDDLTGFAGGGNKARKLEYLMFDAIESGAQAIVTHGAAQSNFLRQCAAACRVLGLGFHAVAMEWPHPGLGRETRPENWTAASAHSGNRLLGEWLKADVRVIPDGDWTTLEQAAGRLAEELRTQGVKVYEIPGGGSSGVGSVGFVAAVEELMTQGGPFDRVIVASGSGGTQTGLTYGFAKAGQRTRVIGICSDDEPEMVEDFSRIAGELDDLLLCSLRLSPNEFDLRTEFAGPGYQVPTPEAARAIRQLAQQEGIFLDPAYTGKAFSGLLAMAEQGELSGRTLFWHTGGFPGLFVDGYQP
jgi:D-cysteine desulfhydrase family pyridoxal phosphate-dependent enzyme